MDTISNYICTWLIWHFCDLQSYINYITYLEMKLARRRPTRLILPNNGKYDVLSKGKRYTSFFNSSLSFAQFKGIVKFAGVKRPVVSI